MKRHSHSKRPGPAHTFAVLKPVYKNYDSCLSGETQTGEVSEGKQRGARFQQTEGRCPHVELLCVPDAGTTATPKAASSPARWLVTAAAPDVTARRTVKAGARWGMARSLSGQENGAPPACRRAGHLGEGPKAMVTRWTPRPAG